MFSLTGRRALVTGGSRGIGLATSRLLARAGAAVSVGYRSRTAEAQAVVAELRALGVTAAAFAHDIGTAAGADALVDDTVRTLGGLDILVHNAGIWPPADLGVDVMPDERWRETMSANTDAMFFISRAAARVLPRGGRIIHVASTAGQRGEAFHSDYAASKGAMISFVKSLAVELAPRDITVNSVAPGWVDTEMCAEAFADGGRERIAKTIPIGRVASPEDIAGPILFLATPFARHVTGEILNVNGGSVLCG
ncbi:MAG: SDR family oxidoreductase [Gemmatimonadetes bacterium]|nr:SDR family oxidoreductase [Gemmatimonadota bacterium]